MKKLSKADARIIAVHERGYRADPETGDIYSPSGKKLKPFRIRRSGHPNLQFSACVEENQHSLYREGGTNKYKHNVRRCNINVHRFIEYCKRGGDAFQNDAVIHYDGNKLNVSPDNIKSVTHKEAGEIRSRNTRRKKVAHERTD